MIKQLLRKTGKFFYFAKEIKRALTETFVTSKRPSFDGWYGLKTYTKSPWENQNIGDSSLASKFYEVDCQLRERMSNKSFTLLRDDLLRTIDLMDKLRWRNYIVFWSFIFAAKSTKSEIKNYIEAGVADGISAFYAINAAESYNYEYKAYFYDAWGEVQMNNPSTKPASNFKRGPKSLRWSWPCDFKSARRSPAVPCSDMMIWTAWLSQMLDNFRKYETINTSNTQLPKSHSEFRSLFHAFLTRDR